jgi:hypothetical protein
MALDFPNTPTTGQVYQGYVWDGQAWQVQGAAQGAVRYDLAQGLTANQQSQARSNTGVTKKNYIINGAMQISQENGAVAGTINGYFPVDQFEIGHNMGGALTVGQVASPTPAGSSNRIRVTVTTADAAVAAGDVAYLRHRIEGLRTADLRFGSSAAKTITIQFGCKGPAGTYGIAVWNLAANRSFFGEYTISAAEANTDVIKSVTLPGDIAGVWATDNTASLNLYWTLMAGSNYQGAAGVWGTTAFLGTSNQFNFMGTAGNVFELFDVGLYEGSVAPPFMVPDYASELRACQRYYWKTGVRLQAYSAAGANFMVTLHYPTEMRIAGPTMAYGGITYTNASGVGTTAPQTTTCTTVYATATAAGQAGFQVDNWVANARI